MSYDDDIPYSEQLKDKDWTKQAEANLWEIANGARGEQEKLDKEGNVHMLRFKKAPDFDANKFILKNMSNGKWADKIETVSTQVNVNLTASYNEVTALIEKQKQKILEKRRQEELNEIIIDVEDTQNDNGKSND